MAAMYNNSVKVASMRKAAKVLCVKQSLPRAQIRGTLLAAAATKVEGGEGGWIDVIGDDCISCITDPANQTNPWRVAPTDAELAKWKALQETDSRCRKARIIDATAV
jgi:hypothetical protein